MDWKEKLADAFGIDPDAMAVVENDGTDSSEKVPVIQKTSLIVSIDRRHRAGKQVTIVSGFVGSESSLADLGRKLKAGCSSGGSVKDGEIIIQGDFRNKVVDMLLKMGYKAKRGN
ncbi:MAG: translation initiation factor [Bacteroidales bacterium]|nr:translation initiation factor [Candidatus Cacconaster merdequi]